MCSVRRAEVDAGRDEQSPVRHAGDGSEDVPSLSGGPLPRCGGPLWGPDLVSPPALAGGAEVIMPTLGREGTGGPAVTGPGAPSSMRLPSLDASRKVTVREYRLNGNTRLEATCSDHAGFLATTWI